MPAPRATRACARSTTSARHRLGSTRRRRCTTASAARPQATCSRSCRRPKAWTSKARSSCWPNAMRVELQREEEDPREAEKRKRRERLLELLSRTAAYYERFLWESEEAAQGARVSGGAGIGGGDPARVPCGLCAQRVGSGAAGLAQRRLLRAGAVRHGPRAALEGERAPVRPLPLADHVPAGGRSRAGAGLRRARDERGTAARST